MTKPLLLSPLVLRGLQLRNRVVISPMADSRAQLDPGGHRLADTARVDAGGDRADLIAIGRQALFNPNWALHAELALGVENEFASWPVQAGWWLDKRQRSLAPEDAAAAVKRVAGV
jgi:2,4-dienoyl-CoA reductase-like NADH-dependent reductase (Old Yellow Enzyme family)